MKTFFILLCVSDTVLPHRNIILTANRFLAFAASYDALAFGEAICAVTLTVSSVPINDVDGKYPRFIEFPDGDGNLHYVDLKAAIKIKVLRNIVRNPANSAYHLYTRRNPKDSQILGINDADSVTSSNFNSSLTTVVIVHGWLGKHTTNLNPVVRDAFLEKSDVNVICMDWQRLASSIYNIAVAGVPAVGRGLGQFLNFLNKVTGAPFDKMHLIGFSLGAHLVGNAGRELDGRLARITGLDPAGPLWNLNDRRLKKTDAIYVEAIHTDGGIGGFGIGSAVATVDFFANGGSNQPGCLINVCNHERSWHLFAASVTFNHLVGRECKNNLQITTNSCRGNYLYMGNDILNKTGSGLYRVNTGRKFPF